MFVDFFQCFVAVNVSVSMWPWDELASCELSSGRSR